MSRIMFFAFFLFSPLGMTSIDTDLSGTVLVQKSKYYDWEKEKLAFSIRYNLLAFSVLDMNFEIQKLCFNIHKVSRLQGSYFYLTNSLNNDCEKSLFEKEIFKSALFYNWDLALIENDFIIRYDDIIKKIKLLNLQKENPELKLFESSVSSINSLSTQIAVIPGQAQTKKSIKNGAFCEQVDDKCNDTMERSCHKCEHGSFSVIKSNCRSRYSKVCGHNNCGEKGAPACIRGYGSTKLEIGYCFPDSPIGFCQKNLRVFCHNNLLICE